MRTAIVAALVVCSIGGALADDAYDTIYVSDPAVCDQAGKGDIESVLFDLQASAVLPREAIWVRGEMICRLVDVRMSPSAMGWDDGDTEVLATARCYGPYEDYMDQVVLTNVSQNINLHYGDTGEPIPPSLEIISMRADLGGEEMAKSDGYDGIYTACPPLTAKDFAWPK
ncbi:hypothetical protein DevBK_04705 [Devosia sp. BK]|uniref:hypothetical protein n=1 Tax=Devosia sp. BK TaxID=2871706 RepID=UPI00293B33EB|nr:hypothetical protein [Devosia sp. BK]MDV3250630.1 hypothetical protein [Devosia sp. BK]